MRRDRSIVTISIASGKGGVGKTCIAANLAYVISHVGKTLLIDLDLQNQGCTSLLARHASDTATNAYNLLRTGIIERDYGPSIRNNLSFLPATSWSNPPTQTDIIEFLNSIYAKNTLAHFLDEISSTKEFRFVIIDCHGGIDLLSYAAFHQSTYTLIVTEPDIVTFSGTLDLIRFYQQNQGWNAPDDDKPVINPSQTESHKADVKFVVNRLKGKLSLKSLNELYKPYITEVFEKVSEDSSIFCFIPTEGMLGETFGHVPFYVEAVPKSTFARKLGYMAFELLNPHTEISKDVPVIGKFLRKRYQRRTYRTVRALEQIATQRAMTFAVTVMFLGFGVTVASIMASIGMSQLDPTVDPSPLNFQEPTYLNYAMGSFYALIGVGNVVFFRVLWVMKQVYAQKYAFEKSLRGMSGASLIVFSRARLVLILAFRLGFWVMSLTAGVFAAACLAFAFVLLMIPQAFFGS